MPLAVNLQNQVLLDRYQLVECIGRGGMAEVYHARHTSIGGYERDVAIKVLLPQFCAEPEFVDMLLDEARIAGSIDHPNVVQVLDVGRNDEIFYLVMEFVRGRDLRSIAKQIPGGALPVHVALYIIGEVLRGLHAVHNAVDGNGQPRKIVHRDISPANVMVDRRGFVKLGDFGIAHAESRLTRTRVGAVKGKSRYMAPEQLAGMPLDPRADLYALGVTMFEALMGEQARESSRATPYGPMFTWPKKLPPEISPDIVDILRRSVADEPTRRYPDAEAFRADVQEALRCRAGAYGPDDLERDLRQLEGRPSQPNLRVVPLGAAGEPRTATVSATPARKKQGSTPTPQKSRGASESIKVDLSANDDENGTGSDVFPTENYDVGESPASKPVKKKDPMLQSHHPTRRFDPDAPKALSGTLDPKKAGGSPAKPPSGPHKAVKPIGKPTSGPSPVMKLPLGPEGELPTPSRLPPVAHPPTLPPPIAPVLVAVPPSMDRFMGPSTLAVEPLSQVVSLRGTKINWAIVGGVAGVLAFVLGLAVYLSSGAKAAPVPLVEAAVVEKPKPVFTRPLPAATTETAATNGRLAIAGPAKARILIGGTFYGRAPANLELPPGTYAVKLQRVRGKPLVRRATVEAGKTVILK